MKRTELLFGIIMIAFCCTMKSVAQSFKLEGDNLYYQLIDETHVKVVQPTEGSYNGDITIPKSIQYPVQDADPVTATVTEIGSLAFASCTLTSITIPSSVKTIQNNAFANCTVTRVNFASISHLCGLSFGNSDANPLSKSKHLYITNEENERTVLNSEDFEGITNIGQYAFYGCTGIAIVTIPQNVETVGNSAFSGCTGLTEVNLQGIKTIGTNAFTNCSGLTKARFSSLADLCQMSFGNSGSNPLYYAHHLYLGNNSNQTFTLTLPEVVSVGKYAFAGGSELISVTIPATVESFGEDAFKDCTKLQTVDYASVDQHLDMFYGNENSSPLRFAGTAKFGGETTSNITITRDRVNQYAFANCQWLNGVTINAGTIDKAAFMNCRGLTNVELNNVTVIANDAFKDCRTLKSITLPETLKSIGVQAFSNCWILEAITIPSNVTNLSNEAFMYCYGLKTATINASASQNAGLLPYKFFYGCSGLESVQLSDNITAIGNEAFRGCSSLLAFPVSTKVNIISGYAFYGCNSIQTLELPASIRQINTSAFQNCTGLSQIIINQPDPSDETINIAENVFADCNQLECVYSHALKAPSADPKAFGSKTNIRLYLDEGATDYDKAPWSDFDNQGTMAEWTISYFIYGIENAVHTETLITGATITPYEYDLEKPEGWISTEWLDNIPAVMPNENVEIHGVFTVEKKLDNNLYYRFRKDYDAKLEATVVPHQDYQGFETANVPASIEDGNKIYAVVSIADKAFKGCENLGAVTLANSIKAIGKNAFANCTALTGIELPAAVTVMSDSLFYNCTNLTSVTMSDNVTEIGASAFNQCSSLSIETLPSKLVKIGELAFCKCKGLGSITIPASVTEFGNRVFLDCEELTTASFAVESPLTSLPDYTFQNCRKLVNFLLSPAMNSIKNGAFMNCTGLEIVNIPNGVVSIFANAFNGCTNLTKVIIPEGLTSLGGDAFKGCTKITQVTVVAETQPDGPGTVFEQKVYDEATLYVPNKDNFDKTPWKNFKTIANRTSHTLTYVVDGQSYETAETHMTGDLIVAKAEPTKEGHEFSHWRNLPATMPNEDCEVSGAFKYQITYKDSENDDELYTEWLYYGDQITAPAELDKESYSYTLDPTLEDLPTMPADDTVIMVTYLLSETVQPDSNGIRYYIYTQTKNNVAPHAEVMPAETGSYTNTTVTLPDDITYKEHNYPVTVIRNDAFKDCKNMTEITLSSNLQKINTQAFANCNKLAEIDIPESVETIGNEVFLRCTGLNKVRFVGQSGIETLPAYTFMGCEALNTIDLPASLTTIANEVFRGCGSLKVITLPAALTTLGDYAFLGCNKLETITIENQTAFPDAFETTFEKKTYEIATLFVPETLQAHLTNPWNNFENVDLGSETVEEKCAKPKIFYEKGTLKFTCETPGADIKSEITVSDAIKTEGAVSQILNKIYVIKASATATGKKRSDVATATFRWQEGQCEVLDNGFERFEHDYAEQEQQGVPGDMNGDGQATAEDAALILQKLVGKNNNNNQGE